MLNLTGVNINEAGSYIISITYANKHKQIIITISEQTEPITYTLLVNQSKSTTIALNDSSVDFKEYFIIKDENDNNVEVLDSMIDASGVNLSAFGSYTLKLNYNNQTLTLVINVVDNTEPLEFFVAINEALSTELLLGITNINFKDYFIITDSNDNISKC